MTRLTFFRSRTHLSLKWQELFDHWLITWRDVFKVPSLPQEIVAGMTVAAVALPLNIALAVSCGLPPSAGLIAGAVGGFVAAFFGGAPLQVTGPAAALNFMVFALVAQFGHQGAMGASLVVGALQLLLGFFFLGSLAKKVPEVILAGFMSGVGLKIIFTQFPSLLGIPFSIAELTPLIFSNSPLWLEKISLHALVCSLLVMLVILTTKQYKRLPGALLALIMATGISVVLNWEMKRVGEVSIDLTTFKPMFPQLSLNQWRDLFWQSLPLALMASVESLLASMTIDRMTKAKKPHDPNLELVGQGLANMATGFFAGMPVTGVIVRSSVNIQSGAKTKLSSLIHCVLLFISMIFFSSMIALIPTAALAGILSIIGLNLLDGKTLKHAWKNSPFEGVSFLCTTLGTVSGHLIGGMVVGGLIFFLAQRYRRKQVPRITLQGEKVEKVKREIPVNWYKNISETSSWASSSFVHQNATVIGKVILGKNVHLAAECSVRADEGSPFFIGDNVNIQDGVVIHALKSQWVLVKGQEWAVYIGENVSLAHQALVHGPCYIGENSFIGFKSTVHNSIVGPSCFIGIGAVVVGVEIPPSRMVPHGMVVDSQEKVDQLPFVKDEQRQFSEEVVEVNKNLVSAYRGRI